MNNYYCCVPHCSSWAKRNPELSFHSFPVAGNSKVLVENEFGDKELVDRRKEWIRQLKIGKKRSNYMKVCSLHFKDTDFFQKEKVKRRRLKCNAVPSKNLPGTVVLSSSPKHKFSRATRKIGAKSEETTDLKETTQEVSTSYENGFNFEDEEDRQAAEALLALKHTRRREEDEAGPSHRDFNV